MFVFLKEPMGRRTIGAVEVCGRCYNYGRLGPARIKYKEWLEFQGVLEEALLNRKLIKERLGFDIPDITFKATEVYQLPDNLIVQIAAAIGLNPRLEEDWPNERRRHYISKLKDRIKMSL